jgi:apolipoprotein D and lipocalin family protein
MRNLSIALSALALLMTSSAALAFGPKAPAGPPVTTVAKVDLDRYLGRWFEIATIVQSFQRGCNATQAEYSFREDGKIRVINTCRLGSPTGEVKSAEGRARVVDTETGAKLKVSFFWPFEGDYWILALEDDGRGPYLAALVGSPDRKSLWILARETTLAPEVLARLLNRAKELGFDTSKLEFTRH